MDDAKTHGMFDRVIAHPSVDVTGHTKEIKRVKGGDLNFLKRLLRVLDDDGKMVVIVHLGLLYRSGMEARERRRLIGMNVIDAVIALPSGMLTWTSIPVAVLVMKKRRERHDVFFIDASDTNLTKVEDRRNVLKEESISRIVDAYGRYSDEQAFSAVVNPEDIARNGFLLTPSTYVESKREENNEVDPDMIDELTRKLDHTRNKVDALIEALKMNSKS
jgi:type I restriction enzyme M protein